MTESKWTWTARFSLLEQALGFATAMNKDPAVLSLTNEVLFRFFGQNKGGTAISRPFLGMRYFFVQNYRL